MAIGKWLKIVWFECVCPGLNDKGTFDCGRRWYAGQSKIITECARHDSKQASALIEGIEYECLLMKRYDANDANDANAIISVLGDAGGMAVTLPKKNRIENREYDKRLYKLRYLVENEFLRMKEWRGSAARYVKNASSFIAIVHRRSMLMWAKLI